MSEDVSRLRILCIHGYRQNAVAFKERMGAFRKITKKYADLVFISAPNHIPVEKGEDQMDTALSESCGWWFSREDDYFSAQDETHCCKGYKESLAVVEQAFKEQGFVSESDTGMSGSISKPVIPVGPFDGVLGFSQGAAMVSFLCGIQQQQQSDSILQFNFAMLIAGFKSRCSSHDQLLSVPIELPTLHVYGDTDKVISKEMSEELKEYFINPVLLNHPGGHFIPASSAHKHVYIDFFRQMIERKQR